MSVFFTELEQGKIAQLFPEARYYNRRGYLLTCSGMTFAGNSTEDTIKRDDIKKFDTM